MRQSVFCFDTLHLGGNLLQLQFQPLGGELAHRLLYREKLFYPLTVHLITLYRKGSSHLTVYVTIKICEFKCN